MCLCDFLNIELLFRRSFASSLAKEFWLSSFFSHFLIMFLRACSLISFCFFCRFIRWTCLLLDCFIRVFVLQFVFQRGVGLFSIILIRTVTFSYCLYLTASVLLQTLIVLLPQCLLVSNTWWEFFGFYSQHCAVFVYLKVTSDNKFRQTNMASWAHARLEFIQKPGDLVFIPKVLWS